MQIVLVTPAEYFWNPIFHLCEHHKQSIHPHCTGVEAEVSDTGFFKLGQMNPKYLHGYILLGVSDEISCFFFFLFFILLLLWTDPFCRKSKCLWINQSSVYFQFAICSCSGLAVKKYNNVFEKLFVHKVRRYMSNNSGTTGKKKQGFTPLDYAERQQRNVKQPVGRNPFHPLFTFTTRWSCFHLLCE